MILIAVLLIFVLQAESSGQEYAGDPTRLGAGARALGMGSAFVAISDDATALYWNVAGLSQLQSVEVQAQHAEQFGGSVNHDFVALAVPSRMGTFATGIVRIGVDGITLTGLEDPALPLSPGNRPVATRQVGTSDYTFSIGYARTIREGLSLGGAVKAVWRNLDAGNGTGYGIDLGLHYSLRDFWRLGLVIRDLTQTNLTYDSGAKDRISPSIDLGVAHTRALSALRGRIVVSFSASLKENTSDAEDHQSIRGGLEYRHKKGLAGRLGLEGDHLTLGAGIEPTNRIRVDVAFLENGNLDNTYRISASLYF